MQAQEIGGVLGSLFFWFDSLVRSKYMRLSFGLSCSILIYTALHETF